MYQWIKSKSRRKNNEFRVIPQLCTATTLLSLFISLLLIVVVIIIMVCILASSLTVEVRYMRFVEVDGKEEGVYIF